MPIYYSEASLAKRQSKALEAGSTNLEYEFDREIFSGPSNNEILGVSGQIPIRTDITLKNIYELPRQTSGHTKICWIQPRRITRHARCLVHLDTRLPPPVEHDHDVYLVTQPDVLARASVISPWHWSIYCNGHFYHLSIKSNSKQRPNTEGESKIKEVYLKHEDLSSQNTPAYEHYLSQPGRVLSAYQIGQTEYDPEQIFKIATWVISFLQTYNILAANCQHFVMGLCARILSRQRYEHVFIGAPAQIVTWDLGKRSGLRFANGWGAGFMISYKSLPDRAMHPRRVIEQTHVQYDAMNLALLWPESPERFIFPNSILEYSFIRRQLITSSLSFMPFSVTKRILRKEDRTNRPEQWRYALLLPKIGLEKFGS